MAKLVDIRSRDTTPITINLRMKDYGATPALAGTTMKRVVARKDKKSGEMRAKVEEIKCPPAIRWPAKGTLKGLPASVLDHPTIKSMLARRPGRRPLLVVVREYEPEPEVAAKPVAAAPKASKKRGKKAAKNTSPPPAPSTPAVAEETSTSDSK